MKFQEMVYQRPDMEELGRIFSDTIQQIKAALSLEVQLSLIKEVNRKRREFETQSSLAQVKHTIDTRDPFFEAEVAFFDQNNPRYKEWVTQYFQALSDSKWRKELEGVLGSHFFVLIEMSLKTFKPEIMSELAQENQLASEYRKLMASAKIMFEGEERNLSGLWPFQESQDRTMRKSASEAFYGFMADHQAELDRIYDDLVKVRHNIALKLGFKNFIPLGYLRMARSDYDAEMVKVYRDEVFKTIVPIVSELFQQQKKRLGLDRAYYYDIPIRFKSGNPRPQDDPDWIISQGKKMYHELSPETAEFIDFMLDNGLMDLINRLGKAPGGYCTWFPEYKAPFIFSNFNGTSGDVNVLTHEVGHAFQCYNSRDYEVLEYVWPTAEAAEIHSMSMEFITWPWMKLFFQEDAEKYQYMHLSDALRFLPYGVLVDEYQHVVYENPDFTPIERRHAWRELEKKYQPHKDYNGHEFLESGGFWQGQLHIYEMPFYYIDYTLAQVCAFQFWEKVRENFEKGWSDYLKLCKAGGSRSFLDLVTLANLKSPFQKGNLVGVTEKIKEWLDSIDGSKFN